MTSALLGVFWQNVALLEEEADINQLTEYFSYEHFYVIYCKFWELDTDHDLLIDSQDLARHNDHGECAACVGRGDVREPLRCPALSSTAGHGQRPRPAARRLKLPSPVSGSGLFPQDVRAGDAAHAETREGQGSCGMCRTHSWGQTWSRYAHPCGADLPA